MAKKINVILGSGFGLGLMPIVPGSFGALVGLCWHVASALFLTSHWHVRISCIVGIILFSFIHYKLTPWAQSYWGDDDPKNFVLDEIVGYLCVPVFAWVSFSVYWHYLLAFVLFRVLDAVKLPGARYIDRNIHNAHGVLLDDVVSAAYTAIIVSLCF